MLKYGKIGFVDATYMNGHVKTHTIIRTAYSVETLRPQF